ncbi:MAG TPA: SDR family oxidoreductase [Noviherbaspirillum sp.]|nr:SDR family oxidoreductase [Noviherbaspirillum sp.]
MYADLADTRLRAVLTGASGGIGKAIARQLAPHAEWLILVGRNVEALSALKKELGPHVHVVAGDLTEQSTLLAIEDRAHQLGGMNLLVNNAGASDFHAFETQGVDEIRKLLNTNLLSPMLLTRQLLPLLRRAPAAQIINIGSIFGYVGYPGFAAYCASKSGLRGFTQALRRELSDTAINVRHFAPRATSTAINSAPVEAMNRELKNAQDTPEHVASQFMQFLRGSAWETKLGAKESFFVLVNHLLPKMPDKAIFSQLPVIRKYLPR